MNNGKNLGLDDDSGSKEVQRDSAPRARNRTVMLTPEVTGEVRARLAQDLERPAPPRATGFETPQPVYGAPREQRPAPEAAPQPAHSAAQPLEAVKEAIIWTKESAVVGMLVSYDENQNGQIFELRAGRLIVTSDRSTVGSMLYLNDKSVSPMHAIMRIGGSGEIQVLDQLSEFGTRVIRAATGEEQELSGDKCTLEHGDLVKFGDRSFHVCVVNRSDAG